MHINSESAPINQERTLAPEPEVSFSYEAYLSALEDGNELRQKIVELQEKLIGTEKKLELALKASLIDPLTKCFNLNYFIKFKQENFSPNNPEFDYGKTALIYFDIDGLKHINDTYGHSVGDDLIRKTANFLESSFQESDTVVRLHGDEFVVICRNDNNDTDFEENLIAKIDKIQKLANEVTISTIHGNVPLSFSAGVAIFDDKVHDGKIDLNIDDTNNRAEDGMRQRKKNGRTV